MRSPNGERTDTTGTEAPRSRGGYVGSRYVLSDDEKAAVAAAVLALPPMSDQDLDGAALVLAEIRPRARRVAPTHGNAGAR
ncbi:MAG TPA: hypothetical protein VKP64_13025 [Mycobacteriales bacterium]|nr:hypothetical protein [Mycobacteriales bacterium]